MLGGQPEVRIDQEGCATFRVKEGRCSVYVPRMTPAERVRRARMEAARLLADARREAMWLASLARPGKGSNG